MLLIITIDHYRKLKLSLDLQFLTCPLLVSVGLSPSNPDSIVHIYKAGNDEGRLVITRTLTDDWCLLTLSHYSLAGLLIVDVESLNWYKSRDKPGLSTMNNCWLFYDRVSCCLCHPEPRTWTHDILTVVMILAQDTQIRSAPGPAAHCSHAARARRTESEMRLHGELTLGWWARDTVTIYEFHIMCHLHNICRWR